MPMTICKQCVHYLVCMHYSPTRAKCKQFQDSTKYEEVVRCKDCKQYDYIVYDYGLCCKSKLLMKNDDFCSYGERKDNV